MEKKIDFTVGACIIWQDRVLMMFHTKLSKWLFPGGHVEANETPDMALRREVKEETGLDITFLQPSVLPKQAEEIEVLALSFHNNLHQAGDHLHYQPHYLCSTNTADFVQNSESKEMRWFAAGEVEALSDCPDNIKVIAKYAFEKYKEINHG
ncbi:MAG: NUDIX domain-containing protein [Patescibacteria group bacterium]|jgi:ADP-ribose pyrophosphatase YjhB (NUDIX family)